jgi:hypothetical protein
VNLFVIAAKREEITWPLLFSNYDNNKKLFGV